MTYPGQRHWQGASVQEPQGAGSRGGLGKQRRWRQGSYRERIHASRFGTEHRGHPSPTDRNPFRPRSQQIEVHSGKLVHYLS